MTVRPRPRYDKRTTNSRIITALFVGDSLTGLQGDVTLAQLPTLEPSEEDKQHGGTVITEPTVKQKGWLNRLGFFNRDD